MNKPWLRDTPYDIRDDAARDDLLKVYASGFARKKNDGKTFSLSYRSRKHSFQEGIVTTWSHYRFRMRLENKARECPCGRQRGVHKQNVR